MTLARPRSAAWTVLFSLVLGLTPACSSSPSDEPSGDGDGDIPGDGDADATGGRGDGDGDGSGGTGDGDSGGTGGGQGGFGGEGDSLPTVCTDFVPATESSFVPLCEVEGEVRHVRIEGLLAPQTHASTQVLFGYDEAPAGTNPTTEIGQFKALFYGGGNPAPMPQIMALFEDTSMVVADRATFLHAASAVCFDVHHGSSTSPPHFIVWRDGENGADCADFSTLTLESSIGREVWWGGQAEGTINPSLPVFFRQAAQAEATVTSFNQPAVDGGDLLPLSCSTEVPAETSDFVELCETDGPVRHVKIEGLLAPQVHATTQLLWGFDEAPASSPTELASDQLQALFYGGGVPAPGPIVEANFGEQSTSFTDGTDFVHTSSTVCMDVHDGATETPPHFILWRDGENGADCDDFETLTLESATFMELSFAGSSGAIDKSTPVFFRQTSAQAATITVTGVTALSAEEAGAGTTCTTTWEANTDYQRLCTPAAGKPRHVRIEDAASTMNSHYFYLLFGEASDSPTGAPSVGDGSGTFIFTAGRNHMAASATSFRFDSDESTSQYDFGLYTPSASTICLDLGETESGLLQIHLWATGSDGADCADNSTLTTENALYSSSVDDTVLWDAALADGFNYVKTSNTGATLGDIVLSTEPALW